MAAGAEDAFVEQAAFLNWLSSPALPIGTFAFSQGLEYLLDSRLLPDAAALQRYLQDELDLQLAHWDLPILKRCYEAALQQDFERLSALNELLLSGRESGELYQEELLTGAALLRLLQGLDLQPAESSELKLGYTAAFALAAAAAARGLGLAPAPASQVLTACAVGLLQNKVTAACKIMPLGQTAGQRILFALLPEVHRAVQQALTLPDSELGSSTTLTQLGSFLHERQYSRLFRS